MLRKSIDSLIRMVFPHLCIACMEQSITKGQLLCVTCLADMPYTDHFEDPDNKVVQHFYGRIPVRHAAALLHFYKNSTVQNMLHTFKYRGQQEIGQRLGLELATQFSSCKLYGDIDLVVPVPIARSKRRIRGFNQTEVIARAFVSECALPYGEHILEKLFDTGTQTAKTRDEREANVNNSIRVVQLDKVIGRHILVVDDLITTGATAAASGMALLDAGAASVSFIMAGSASDSYF